MDDTIKKALQMRVDGNSFYQISNALKITPEEAKQLCATGVIALQGLESSDLESKRAIEIARLEKIRKVLYEAALEGDVKASSEYLRQSKRYDLLVGLTISSAGGGIDPPKPEDAVSEGAREAVAGIDNDTLERMLRLVPRNK